MYLCVIWYVLFLPHDTIYNIRVRGYMSRGQCTPPYKPKGYMMQGL